MATRGIGPVPDGLDEGLSDFLTQLRRLSIDVLAGRVAGGNTTTAAIPGAPSTEPGPPGPAGPPGTAYVEDLTPPPTPSGVVVSAGLDFVFITTDAPVFTQGNGYSRTLVYFATYGGAGPLPTFSDAVLGHEFVGQVGSFAAPPGVQYHVWLKWRTRDAVLSVSPQGGANGNQVTTSLIGGVNIGPLVIQAGNLADGSVSASKIALLAIDATKFANGIEPVGVVASLPSPIGYTGPKTVLLTSDGKLYRYTGGAWTRALDGADIVANTITAGSIAAGAIGVNQLAANAVTTDKLLVTGRGAAINDDPSMSDVTAWAVYDGAAYTQISVSDAPAGLKAFRFNGMGAIRSRSFNVSAGRQYRVSCYARKTSGTGGMYVRLNRRDATGSGIASGLVTLYPAGPANLENVTTVPTMWTRYAGTAVMEAGSVTAWVEFYANYNTSGVTDVQDLRCDEYVGADLIVDGAIVAQKLAANSIAVGTLAVQNGAIVNAMMANASITNANIVNLSASKLTAGTIAVGEYIQSSDFNTGISGWRFGGNTAELGAANIRGQLTAAQINGNGLVIRDLAGVPILGVGTGLPAAYFAGQVGGGNLLRNASFEVDTDADGLADGWAIYNNGATGTVAANRVSGNGTTYGQRIVAPLLGPSSADQAGIRHSADIAVIAGAKYSLSADTRDSGPTIRFLIDWYTAGLAFISGSSGTFSSSGATWTRRSIGVTAPALAAFARAYVWIEAVGGGPVAASLEVDRIQFEPGDVPTGFAVSPLDKVGIDNQITAANVSTYIASAAIGNAQIGGDIQSTVYTPGSAGWIIRRNGTAEFDAVTIRGQLTTAQLQVGAATGLTQDTFDFARASAANGTNVLRTVNVTPTVNCIIQFSATMDASNVCADSASNIFWAVSAGGGADVILGSDGSTTSYVSGTWPCTNGFAATGGVALTFKLYSRKVPAIPGPTLLGVSSMTIVEIRR